MKLQSTLWFILGIKTHLLGGRATCETGDYGTSLRHPFPLSVFGAGESSSRAAFPTVCC